jgi:uncharacterized protein (TIGR02231 family)
MEGEFLLKPVPPGRYSLKAVYVGYQAQSIEDITITGGKTTYLEVTLNSAEGVKLDEVEMVEYKVPLIDPDMKSGSTTTMEHYSNMATRDINSAAATTAGVYQQNIRGGRGNEETYFVEGTYSPVETIYLADDPSAYALSNLEYTLDVPYTIPCDGSDHTIRIREASVAASYVYHAVPKMETEVFLTAEIPDWHNLQLLSGNANIFFQGTFTGATYINSRQTVDTLKVNLGRDRDVIVTRNGSRHINDKRNSSSYIREAMSWNITIKNNKTAPVHLVLHDQYPLAERKSIQIELTESGNAGVNEKTGDLRWDLVLNTGEKKSIAYNYAVKYPKWTRIVTE